jgi:hypothetical protein
MFQQFQAHSVSVLSPPGVRPCARTRPALSLTKRDNNYLRKNPAIRPAIAETTRT